jgi:streptogramin lyase
VPFYIAAGPDGAMWFTQFAGNRIGRITMDGAITEFSLPNARSGAWGITQGPDRAMWFTQKDGNRIGRISMSGAITEFPLAVAGSEPFAIAAGPDGNLWFTQRSANLISRITPAGQVRSFTVPVPNAVPAGIAAGPDGNMWFTTRGSSQVGWVSTGRKAGLTAKVVGRPAVGSRLACEATLVAPWRVEKSSFAWYRDGKAIPRATGRTYVPTRADAGSRLRCGASVVFTPSQLQWGARADTVTVRLR